MVFTLKQIKWPTLFLSALVSVGITLFPYQPGYAAESAINFLPGQGEAKDASEVVINIPARTLWVIENNQIVRYFPVGLGRVGYPTPTGEFHIIRKVLDPGWENPYLSSGKMRLAPGENNPLGTRWMGFLQNKGGEYGMHGTDNPGSVGKFSSHGCVRLKIPDAEALFDLIDVGTPVHIVYQPVLVRPSENRLRIAVYPDSFHKGLPTVNEIKAAIAKRYPHAHVDEAKIQAALKTPTAQYVEIGTLPPAIPAELRPIAEQPVNEQLEPKHALQPPPQQPQAAPPVTGKALQPQKMLELKTILNSEEKSQPVKE